MLTGGDLPAALLFLPPLPAANQCQAEGYASDQAGAILTKPCTDFFALFVLVEQIIYCHLAAMLSFLPGAAKGGAGLWGGLTRDPDQSTA
jgi:hypothetical protein